MTLSAVTLKTSSPAMTKATKYFSAEEETGRVAINTSFFQNSSYTVSREQVPQRILCGCPHFSYLFWFPRRRFARQALRGISASGQLCTPGPQCPQIHSG